MRGRNKTSDPQKASGGFLESQGSRGDVAVKVRPDEMTDPETDISTHPRPWTRLPRNRRTKLSVMGLGQEYLEKGDPRYKQAMELGNSYRKARSKELAAIHGYVSSGASALLSTASLALAASRYLYEKAAEGGDVDLMKKASALADSARQAELAAWELCAREGMMKRKLDMASVAAPWLIGDRPDKERPGRKSNLERMQERNLPALPPKPPMTIDVYLNEPSRVSGVVSEVSPGKEVTEGSVLVS